MCHCQTLELILCFRDHFSVSRKLLLVIIVHKIVLLPGSFVSLHFFLCVL